MVRPFCVVAALILCTSPLTSPADEPTKLLRSVTFYASFDEQIQGDVGSGEMQPQMRFDDPNRKGRYIRKKGFDSRAFRIAKGRGIVGGALEGFDVLPNRGRLYFPAEGNLAFKNSGWSGTASFWIKTNPDKLLKTPYCDPLQITQKSAGDGGLWIDFPKGTPRDLRLGAFPGLLPGEKRIPEEAPKAPLIRVNRIGFKRQDWHHVAMTWRNLDTGSDDATVTLYIDGERKGRLEKRELAMRWDVKKAGIYVAVNYIGLLDELSLFDRELSAGDVKLLVERPDILARHKRD